MILDTSALLAVFDRGEPAHHELAEIVAASSEPLVVSPYVVAEVDYLVATRHGAQAALAVLAELAGGAWELADLDTSALDRCRGVVERYRDQEVGVADASIVVLADRYRTRTIATMDHRHFDVLRPLTGGRFRLLP